MSNQVQTLKLSDRLQLPATVTRSTAKFLISDLYGNDAGAFALADNQAARDSFVARCTALALAGMIYGDPSRLVRMKKYASTLATYKTDKAGLPVGKLGKLIAAYDEAYNIGRALSSQIDAAADEVSLSVLASSPVFGALVAPPQAKQKASAPSAGVTATVAPKAPKAEADAIKEAAEKAAKIEQERYEARGRAASHRVWNDAVAKQRADSNARKEAAEAEAKQKAWLAAKAQEKARDAAKDHAIAAMEFIALAEMIGIKLTPAQVKKAQAYAAEQQEKLAA